MLALYLCLAFVLLTACGAEEVKRRVGLRYIVDADNSAIRYGPIPLMGEARGFDPQMSLRGRYGKRSGPPPMFPADEDNLS
ncbi:hypothetical protein GCK32_013671 [Trichostrongylus colubriformis]|uniref:Uncharacterized protein n=1 Tax=Trichostrongylus colubriformis TaxID=6319 RepID=A0AAN8IRB7_TRICO